MSVGYGVGGGVGIAVESQAGTPVAPTHWIPIINESIALQTNVSDDATIYGDRSVRMRNYGLVNAQGGMTLSVDGSSIGLPLALWNGPVGGYTKSQLGGYTVTGITGAAVAGTGLGIGVYKYLVAAVWETPAGAKYYMPASTDGSVTTTDGNQKVNLSWIAPSGTVPTGFTLAGYLVFRSEIDAAKTTCLAIAYVSGAATLAFTDDGSKQPVETAKAYDSSIYGHKFKKSFTADNNPLKSFTTTLVKDNDKAEQYALCRMNEFGLSLASGNDPVQATFSLMAARKGKLVNNPAITHTVLRKFMAWASEINVDGTWEEMAEGLTLSCTNNTALVPGLRNKNDYRDVGYGGRNITGTLSRGFEDHKFWTKLLNGCLFDLRAYVTGQHLVEGCWGLIDGQEIYAFPYCMAIELYNCAVMQAGASIGGPDRMIEQINFGAGYSVSEGTDMTVTLYNLTSTDYVS